MVDGSNVEKIIGFLATPSPTPGDYNDIQEGIYLQGNGRLWMAHGPGYFMYLGYSAREGDVIRMRREGTRLEAVSLAKWI